MPQQPKSVLYLTARAVYAALEANERLTQAGVRHYWGKVDKAAAGVQLRAYWLPRRLQLASPKLTAYRAVQPGPNNANRTVNIDAVNDKVTSVDVWLFAEQGQPTVDIERLFDLYSLALFDVLKVESEYSFSGDWQEQDGVSVATDQLRCALTFRNPLVVQQTIAPLNDDNVTLRLA